MIIAGELYCFSWHKVVEGGKQYCLITGLQKQTYVTSPQTEHCIQMKLESAENGGLKICSNPFFVLTFQVTRHHYELKNRRGSSNSKGGGRGEPGEEDEWASTNNKRCMSIAMETGDTLL